MKFEHLLLGFVAMRPCTGYDLKRWLNSEMGRMLRPSTQQSQIYRTLARMSDDGWVSVTIERNDGRPDSKIYRVTDPGRQVLHVVLTEPYRASPDFGDPEFIIRYTLAIFITPQQQIDLVRTELDARLEQATRFRNRDIRPEPWMPDIDPSRMGHILDDVHQYKAHMLDTHINWLKGLLAELTAHKP